MRVIGLDVGRASAVLCCLEFFPDNIQKYFKEHRREFVKVATNQKGIDTLLSYKPDAIVLEPSGHWYSSFWAKVAEVNNIKLLWVGHADLYHQRGSYGFTNKRDDEDALSLAATYFDPTFITINGAKRYLNHCNSPVIREVRQTFLEKEQLAKLRSALIAQVKQRLCVEFPEMARKQFYLSSVRQFTPFVGWLAGIHDVKRYDRFYAASVAPTLNIEISDYTKDHSSMLVELERRISVHLEKLEMLLQNEYFAPYNAIFDNFGFGINSRVLLLMNTYPFDRFLVNGKRLLEREITSSGKRQKRDRSLRKFQGYLGLSYKLKQSGDKTVRSFGGSSMMRAHLYGWAMCQIAPRKKGYKTDTEIGRKLTDHFIVLRDTRKLKGKDAFMRLLFKATRMLFYELLNGIY